MARSCATCEHEDLSAIDRALRGGHPASIVASTYGLTASSVQRHRARHVSAALVPVVVSTGGSAPDAADVPPDPFADVGDVIGEDELGGSVLDRLERTAAYVQRQLLSGAVAGKPTQVINASREMRSLLEVIGRATGELGNDKAPTVAVLNVTTSAEWQRIQATMLRALLPFPEAATAVASALLELQEAPT